MQERHRQSPDTTNAEKSYKMTSSNIFRLAILAIAAILAVSSAANAVQSEIEVRVNGQHLGRGVDIDGEVFVAVSELEAAIDPESRGRDVLTLRDSRLYAAAPWAQHGGAVTIQRQGLISSRVRTVGGETFVPVTDLERAFGARVFTDEQDCVLAIRANDCATCTLAPTHWYYVMPS